MAAHGRGAGPVDRITLLIPGLAGPDDAGGEDPVQAARLLLGNLALPAFARLAGRGDPLPAASAARTLDGMLFEVFGIARPPDGDFPAGAVSRHAFEADAADGAWLRADPVYLHPDMGRLVVFPPRSLALSLDEAARIIAWLDAHEHAPDLRLQPATATCWYARLRAVPRMRCLAPSLAHGCDADASLPQGPDARVWHARMNELQMLLHACPVNEARARRGERPVNSVWFWGAGTLPDAVHASFTAVHGEHELARGLAACAGTRWHGTLADADRLLAACGPGVHLVALDALEHAARGTDIGAWMAALEALERDWLGPLAAALSRGALRRLEVHAGAGAGFSVTRRALRRWWRRVPPAANALGALRRGAGDAARAEPRT